jgi:hypothetical protein
MKVGRKRMMDAKRMLGWASIFDECTHHRPRSIHYHLSARRQQPFLCASRTCNQLYDKCIEGSLDQISRGILAVKKRMLALHTLLDEETRMMIVPQQVLTRGQLLRTYAATSD